LYCLAEIIPLYVYRNVLMLEFAAERASMVKHNFAVLVMVAWTSTFLSAQEKLSVHWEELTAADFTKGIQQSQGTCLLPFGILEKHGPHLPLGTKGSRHVDRKSTRLNSSHGS